MSPGRAPLGLALVHLDAAPRPGGRAGALLARGAPAGRVVAAAHVQRHAVRRLLYGIKEGGCMGMKNGGLMKESVWIV